LGWKWKNLTLEDVEEKGLEEVGTFEATLE
jgi:hypothetical protein